MNATMDAATPQHVSGGAVTPVTQHIRRRLHFDTPQGSGPESDDVVASSTPIASNDAGTPQDGKEVVVDDQGLLVDDDTFASFQPSGAGQVPLTSSSSSSGNQPSRNAAPKQQPKHRVVQSRFMDGTTPNKNTTSSKDVGQRRKQSSTVTPTKVTYGSSRAVKTRTPTQRTSTTTPGGSSRSAAEARRRRQVSTPTQPAAGHSSSSSVKRTATVSRSSRQATTTPTNATRSRGPAPSSATARRGYPTVSTPLVSSSTSSAGQSVEPSSYTPSSRYMQAATASRQPKVVTNTSTVGRSNNRRATATGSNTRTPTTSSARKPSAARSTVTPLRSVRTPGAPQTGQRTVQKRPLTYSARKQAVERSSSGPSSAAPVSAQSLTSTSHELTLLRNRLMQWCYVNATAAASLEAREKKAQRLLSGAWSSVVDVRGEIETTKQTLFEEETLGLYHSMLCEQLEDQTELSDVFSLFADRYQHLCETLHHTTHYMPVDHVDDESPEVITERLKESETVLETVVDALELKLKELKQLDEQLEVLDVIVEDEFMESQKSGEHLKQFRTSENRERSLRIQRIQQVQTTGTAGGGARA